MNQSATKHLRAGMVGMGMIFDETYRPFFESVWQDGLFDRRFGDVHVKLNAVATRREAHRRVAGGVAVLASLVT